ncbi:MAG: type II secretion system protein [Pseudomonadota bacterium]
MRGFTLLELLVVMGLLGVLLAVVMPAGLRMLDQHRDRVALSEAVRELKELGTRAAREGRFIVIGSIERRPFSGPALAPIETHEPAEGWRVTPIGPSVWFYPDGSCTGGTLRLERDDLRATVSLSTPLCEPMDAREG